MAEKRCNRDWCEDVVMGQLSAEAERLFVRLRMKVDAYGRFWGEASMVRGLCLPCLRGCDDGVVDGWLDELAVVGVLVRYAVGAVRYVALVDWDGRVRGASKFPPVVGQGAGWLPVSDVLDEVGDCVDVQCVEISPQNAAKCGESVTSARQVRDKSVTGCGGGAESCGESVTSARQEHDKSVTGRGELPFPPLFPPAPPLSPPYPHIYAHDGVRGGVREEGNGAVFGGVEVLMDGVLRGVNVKRASELSCDFAGAPPGVEEVLGVMRSLPQYSVDEDGLFREWAEDCFEHYKGGVTAGGGLITNWRRLVVRWVKEGVEREFAKRARLARGERGRVIGGRPCLREDIVLDEVDL